jgi:hypothetical protein
LNDGCSTLRWIIREKTIISTGHQEKRAHMEDTRTDESCKRKKNEIIASREEEQTQKPTSITSQLHHQCRIR